MSGPMRRAARNGEITLLSLIFFLAAVNLYPIYQMVMVSFLPYTKLLSAPALGLPHAPTLANFREVLGRGPFPRFFLNSVIVATGTMLISTALAVFGGYSLARLQYPGKALIDKTILFVYVIPPVLLVVPIYVMIVRLHLNNTYASIILAHTLFAVPFGTWLLRGFFLSNPIDVEDSSQVDGAGRLTTLFRIVLPMAAPGVAAVALFAFVGSWDEFLFASIFLSSDNRYTLPIGIYGLVTSYGETNWGNLLAASTIATLPMFVVFLLLQRWLVQGLTAGAVKA
jgi:ABC-type glycerol-3-phosphate transport system permease component